MTMSPNPQIELERSPGYMLGLTYRKLSGLLLEETAAIEHSVTKEVQACMTEQDFSKFMELLHRLNAHAAHLINSTTK